MKGSSIAVDPAVTVSTGGGGGAVDALQSTIMEAWVHRREKILYEYAVSGTITISSSAMVEIKGSGLEDGSVTRHLDKYDQRLAHLEKRQIKEEGEVYIYALLWVIYTGEASIHRADYKYFV